MLLVKSGAGAVYLFYVFSGAVKKEKKKSPSIIPHHLLQVSWMQVHAQLSTYPPHLPGQAKTGCVCTYVGGVSSLIWVRHGCFHLLMNFSVCIKKGQGKKRNPM